MLRGRAQFAMLLMAVIRAIAPITVRQYLRLGFPLFGVGLLARLHFQHRIVEATEMCHERVRRLPHQSVARSGRRFAFRVSQHTSAIACALVFLVYFFGRGHV